MKRILALCVIAAAVVGVTAAQAEVVINESIPFAQTGNVPCANGGAGEDILITGDLHVLISFTINGNNISGKDHFQPQGATAVGLTTGDTYRAVGVSQGRFKGSLQNGQFNETFINNFRMIGPGPDNNFQVHQNIHVTINANGDLTAEVDNSSTDCN